MGRPLSPPQIHRKNIWTLSKFHKTTSECWQRTPDTQKGSPLPSKGVLCGWRSPEATGRIRLKTRGRRLKSKSWEHQRTPDSREHESIRAHPKASIPTLKPSSTQEPTSSRARHTTQILQQRRNIALSCNTQATRSHTKPIRHLKTHYWTLHCIQREEIQLHPPEHQRKPP